MASKILKIVMMPLALSIMALVALSGCGTSSTQLNPYVFLTGVNSVDHTPFFVNAYQAFQVAGLSVGLSEEELAALEEEASSTSTSTSTTSTSTSTSTSIYKISR